MCEHCDQGLFFCVKISVCDNVMSNTAGVLFVFHKVLFSHMNKSAQEYVDEVRNLLTSVGVPEILDEPEAMASFDAATSMKLLTARDLAVEAAERYPENSEVVDQLYMAHMTYTTSRYLYAVLGAGAPMEVPTVGEIQRAWQGESLRPYDKTNVRELIIPSTSAGVFTTLGLPEEAEPFLSFDDKIERLVEAEGLVDSADDEEYVRYFSAYWRIGATEDDNVICVDERADGVIVVLDRDWGFFSMQYMNSSVGHLLLSMQAYMDMLSTVDPETMAEQWPNLVLSDEAKHTFRTIVEAIDPGAMSAGAFWAEALEH